MPTCTLAVFEEWKNRNASSQTLLKAVLVREESLTIIEDVEDDVHATECCPVVIVQFRKAEDSVVPKNKLPDGLENAETLEDRSEGLTVPKTATSSGGRDEMALNNAALLEGGTAGEDKTKLARLIAMLTSIDDK